MPHIYPFIVNDPGEGSQAKRRSQAVILDHLTPPLGRAGLHGDLRELESLIDEYWEAMQLGSARSEPLRAAVLQQLAQLQLPDLLSTSETSDPLDAADGYLCELKEAQVRTGLHRFGQLPEPGALAELLACLARPPQQQGLGLTQALARDHGLELDPWADREEELLPPPPTSNAWWASAWPSPVAWEMPWNGWSTRQPISAPHFWRVLLQLQANTPPKCSSAWQLDWCRICWPADRQKSRLFSRRWLVAVSRQALPVPPPAADLICCPPAATFTALISVGYPAKPLGIWDAVVPNCCSINI